ncbi:phosphotransferase family protein [Actinoplanes subtropicus]|uniref:phosphotransferase family protein n=1 Tax=Actinoplanes subtropicus TaxID=543632 RepID=UPI0004C3F3BC|nr:phosphotransferase [Actinoplanes subtropicus]
MTGRSVTLVLVTGDFFATTDGLERLSDELPERLEAIGECGLPDTLVHGDLHPGNARTDDAGRLTIMDWGDCVIGHPAVDILRLTEGLAAPEPVLEGWAYRWRRERSGSEPLRAAQLMRPIAALRLAVVYAGFLDAIEPAEWP